MGSKNALDIIKKRLNKNPELKQAYLEEKRNYHIACKIRECRKRAKMTQKQLAQRIGTKQSVISRLENAEYTGHSLPILNKISKVLKEPIENLLGTESQNSQGFTTHIPPVMRKTDSFKNWKSSQIMNKRPHVR